MMPKLKAIDTKRMNLWFQHGKEKRLWWKFHKFGDVTSSIKDHRHKIRAWYHLHRSSGYTEPCANYVSGPYQDGMTITDFPITMSRYSKGLLRHSESSAISATFGLSNHDVLDNVCCDIRYLDFKPKVDFSLISRIWVSWLPSSMQWWMKPGSYL